MGKKRHTNESKGDFHANIPGYVTDRASTDFDKPMFRVFEYGYQETEQAYLPSYVSIIQSCIVSHKVRPTELWDESFIGPTERRDSYEEQYLLFVPVNTQLYEMGVRSIGFVDSSTLHQELDVFIENDVIQHDDRLNDAIYIFLSQSIPEPVDNLIDYFQRKLWGNSRDQRHSTISKQLISDENILALLRAFALSKDRKVYIKNILLPDLRELQESIVRLTKYGFVAKRFKINNEGRLEK